MLADCLQMPILVWVWMRSDLRIRKRTGTCREPPFEAEFLGDKQSAVHVAKSPSLAAGASAGRRTTQAMKASQVQHIATASVSTAED